MRTFPRHQRTHAGFSLIEMVVTLFLLGIAFSHLLPTAKAGLDRFTVRSAREELVGLFHRTRQEAVHHGGAALALRTVPPTAHLVVAGDTLAGGAVSEDPGVSMSLSRGRTAVRLDYGPLGLGRVASQTIRIRKGAEEAILVVSSLGRLVRR